MRRIAVLAGLAGFAVLIALIANFGWGSIVQSFGTLGFGLLLVTALHLPPLALSALAWQALSRPVWNRSFLPFLEMRWIRESVDQLLPLSQAGGALIGARTLWLRGLDAGTAAASLVVDTTLETLSQLVFTALGVALLIQHTGFGRIAQISTVGLVAATLLMLGFVFSQHRGLFKLIERGSALLARQFPFLSGPQAVNGLHAGIVELYRNRRAFVWSGIWHLASWAANALETWAIPTLLGHVISMRDAIMIEALGHAARTAAFFVPGGLGVQEGAYVMLASMVGLSPQDGLALSLIKRARELILGPPALLAWQLREGSKTLRPARAKQSLLDE